MRVKAATLFGLEIPLAQRFVHGSHARAVSDALVLRLVMEDGTVGYGEGLPRPYVTGETTDSVRRRLRDVIWPVLSGEEFETPTPAQLLRTVGAALPPTTPSAAERQAGVVAHNVARCLVELALLDALAKAGQQSLSEALPPHATQLTYSGVIGMVDVAASARQAEQMAAMGLTDCKIKVGDEASVERVAAVRRVLGAKASIRVDANGVWDLDRAVEQISALASLGIDACEEPLGRERRGDLAVLASRVDVPILLDESLVTVEDAVELGAIDGKLQLNLRVSKCGGLEPCLELADIARDTNMAFVIGCQVGETSILSAAGRHLAAHLDDHRHLEGSFGTLLLVEDIASPSLAFGAGGRAELLEGIGLGVHVVDEQIERFAVFRDSLE